jgi:hypothetical protein
MNRFIAVTAGALFVTFGGAKAQAAAFDHPGHMCQMETSDGRRMTELGIYNASYTNQLRIHCPVIVKDQPAGITGAQITVYDRNPGDDVVCTLTLTDYFDATYYRSTVRSNGSSQAPQTLSFGTPNPNAHFGTIDCTVPAATTNGFSYFANYIVFE